jgi:hypothetical protein
LMMEMDKLRIGVKSGSGSLSSTARFLILLQSEN